VVSKEGYQKKKNSLSNYGFRISGSKLYIALILLFFVGLSPWYHNSCRTEKISTEVHEAQWVIVLYARMLHFDLLLRVWKNSC